jgi:putative membrane protein insertion efficiency factor
MLAFVGLAAVRIYRMAISPYHPPVCRFTPSCSEYAETALRRYGFPKGAFLSLCRILRCHPFSPGGYDPVN